tara:strand:- start:229 stop:1392 length:1164 start_codon:yes stop_codon:yes gene_type:complete
MASPTLQFKRGLLANLPGLKAGEPGFTTDSYDLYVGIDETLANNKLVGSGRYWSVNSTSKGSGVNLVEGTSNGTNFVTLKAPDSLSGIVTYTMPGSDGTNNQVLATNGSGTLSFIDAVATLTIAADSGSNDTVNLLSDTLTFTGGDGIDTAVTDNTITITASSITTAQLAAATLVTESEGIGSNDNDTTLPTSAAVKDYVDSNITSQDLDVAGDSGTGAVDLDSQSLTIAGTTNEIETSASNQSITIGLPNDVTVSNNLTVSGNLYVNGSTTQVNTATTTIEDQLLDLGMVDGAVPSSDLNKDIGVLFNYYTDAAKKAAVYWDDSTSRIVVSADVSESSGVLTNNTGGALEVASLYVSGCTGSTVEVIKCTNSEIFIENVTIDGGSF